MSTSFTLKKVLLASGHEDSLKTSVKLLKTNRDLAKDLNAILSRYKGLVPVDRVSDALDGAKSRIKRSRSIIKDAAASYSIKAFTVRRGKQFSTSLKADSAMLSLHTLKDLKQRLRCEIQDFRESAKRLDYRTMHRFGEEFQILDNVFVESNSIIKMLKAKKARALYTDKRPNTSKHHIGVEIECFYPSSVSKETFNEAFLAAGLESRVEIKSDASIRPFNGHTGVELTVLDTESSMPSTIEAVCKVLNSFDAKVNKSCGLHVHIDVRHRDRYEVAKRLVKAQWLLFKLVPASRRSNTYCKRTRAVNFNASCRYRAINLASYRRHSTIEVRLHSGTTDSAKIVQFIKLLSTIVNSTIETSEIVPRSITGWLKLLKILPTSKLAKYVLERSDKFKDAAETEDSVDETVQVICPQCDSATDSLVYNASRSEDTCADCEQSDTHDQDEMEADNEDQQATA